ncbi:hypothetical protein [Leptothoe kymatousa]|uniref:Uncharacterized protein n=1 Tax=Leptothoe kymatousa TAU-MAC 1615 TaxID=2364775 RepID=A0ABS5XZP9_9CYAN|nr:hypothetical protein [Leptothoe kymatousa]MBT9311077.1 hypothetical protein [Leptothoe kymatousa TAU-MAC 1615]
MQTKSWILLPLWLIAIAVAVNNHRPLQAQQVTTPLPIMTIPVSEANITLRVENQTPAAITYEALGDTQPRVLTSGQDATLQSLRIPTTLTFFYQDSQKDRQLGQGLLRATLELDEDTNTLDIVISPTLNLAADVSNIIIESNGNVFVF